MAIDSATLQSQLTKIAGGDQQAFHQFYQATFCAIFAVIIRITVNRELAEEVVSDVYLQAWRSAGHFDAERAAPLTWLIMIARSRAIDALRRERSATKGQQAMLSDFDAPEAVSHGPLQTTAQQAKKDWLKQGLSVLDEVERQMIVLAFYRDMSHREIARYTGKPLGSVKTILRRAQRLLRKALKKPARKLPGRNTTSAYCFGSKTVSMT